MFTKISNNLDKCFNMSDTTYRLSYTASLVASIFTVPFCSYKNVVANNPTARTPVTVRVNANRAFALDRNECI